MLYIVPEISSLEHYLDILKTNPTLCDPDRCPHCGKARLWQHGSYDRKPDRSRMGALNPVPILRFFCPACDHTCSALPECIAPRRWYLWVIQQAVLQALLKRQSVRSVSQANGPARSTCRRWLKGLQEKAVLHRATLCAFFSELGRQVSLADFWQACWALMPLSTAMRFCHVSGVNLP